jgi:vancomycin permeability regulator SanA
MALTIIHLGGSVHRLNKAIEVYRQHPGAFIIISSESNTQQCVDKLKVAGIPSSDYVFDFNAWNTITNFTATYNYIRKRGTKTLFVVTDKFHMPRSMAIAKVVYLFTGVKLVACESLEGDLNRKEKKAQVRGAMISAALWKFFGYSPGRNGPAYRARIDDIRAEKARAQLIAPVTTGP